MEKLSIFNDILKTFKINAFCVNFKETNNYFYYDLKLQDKTKVKDITRFSDEISLKLKTPCKPSVKILHNEGVVRLEFISNNASNLQLFDLFAEGDTPPPGNLICLLGQSVDGNKIWMNIENNPNTIISGTTGSGKSVLLHNIIANINFFNKSQIYLIDPKNIEFSHYENIPNIEVGYSYEEANYIIDNLLLLMENRFAMIKSGINANKIPSAVLIIDEFADLILQDSNNELYSKILRLSQKCRAAKIHIILATQRPSVNIINGAIKANFPSRIACKVASAIDSKIILDSAGAENLNGGGDAILKDNFRNSERFQIAFTDPVKSAAYFTA